MGTNRQLSQLMMAEAVNSAIRKMDCLEKQEILFLVDFCIQPFDNYSRMFLMDVIEEWHGKRCTLTLGHLPVVAWYDVFGGHKLAALILDRPVNNANPIELQVGSLKRKREVD